jgi:hypothetical protein
LFGHFGVPSGRAGRLLCPGFNPGAYQKSNLGRFRSMLLLGLALDRGAQIGGHSNVQHVVGLLFHRHALTVQISYCARLSDSELPRNAQRTMQTLARFRGPKKQGTKKDLEKIGTG